MKILAIVSISALLVPVVYFIYGMVYSAILMHKNPEATQDEIIKKVAGSVT